MVYVHVKCEHVHVHIHAHMPSCPGHGFSSFVFEYLVHGEQSQSLRDPAAALRALATFDEQLAESWRSLLASPWEGGLTRVTCGSVP